MIGIWELWPYMQACRPRVDTQNTRSLSLPRPLALRVAILFLHDSPPLSLPRSLSQKNGGVKVEPHSR